MGKILVWTRLPLLVIGLVMFFIGERHFGAESYHRLVCYTGLALTAVAAAWTLWLSFLAKSPAEARSWRYLVLWMAAVPISLVLYIVYQETLGSRLAPDTLGTKLLLAAWTLPLCLALFAGIGSEWAMRESGRGDYAEPRRVARAGLGWMAIGMLFSALVAINYAADRKDVTRDWSYLKVRTPSPVTLNMMKTLTQELDVALFYPTGNEVRTLVESYFSALAAAEPKVKVRYYDKDMHPTQAESYRVSRNGQIVIDFGGKKNRIDTGTTLAKARNTLKQLDQEFQKNFLELTSAKKTLYFTRGHGESSWIGDAGNDPLRSLRLLEGFLRQQNYTVRFFGVGEGAASAVPDDAAAVVIVGPTEPFSVEEVDTLRRYVEGGGNLMVFLDIDRSSDELAAPLGTSQPLYKLLQEMGIRYNEVPVANDKADGHVAATRSPADHWFIFSNVFTSHDSVVALARHDERVALVMYRTGYLSVTPQLGGWKAFETVRSVADAFADADRDFKLSEGEKRDAWPLGAVAERQSALPQPGEAAPKSTQNSRVVVFSDATAISDALVRNIGNLLYFDGSLKWLVGESELAGAIASDEDVKIRHTRKEDVTWFYGTTVLVPLLVLGAGFLATRRKKPTASARKAG